MDKQSQKLYLAIDQGGHASRALVFDDRGECIASHSEPINTHRPCHNCVEHDPQQLIDTIRIAINRVLSDIDVRLLQAAGLATQRSSIVCWDKVSGKTLSPVISWQDTRADKQIMALSDMAEYIHTETGLRLSAHYGASKIKWCIDNLPDVQTALEHKYLVIGPLASFLIYKLTREHNLYADPSNASRTLLYNPALCQWSEKLLSLFSIPAHILPECTKNFGMFGHINIDNTSIALNTVTGDQPAALFSEGEPQKDIIYINAGTGAFLQACVPSFPANTCGLLKSIALHDGLKAFYVIEGTVNGAVSALKWSEETLGIYHASQAMDEITSIDEQAPIFINTVSGLGSPFWRSDIEPHFIGDGNNMQKFQAVVESIIFLINENLQRIQRIYRYKRIVVSGGLSNSDQFCQWLADISHLEVTRTDMSEATARGIAWLCAGKPPEWRKASPSVQYKPAKNEVLELRFRKWQGTMSDITGQI